MVGIFSIAKRKYVAKLNIQAFLSRFEILDHILVEYSTIRYVLVTNTVLNHNMLCDCYCSTVDTSTDEILVFTFRTDLRAIRVTEQDLNHILRFFKNNCVLDFTA